MNEEFVTPETSLSVMSFRGLHGRSGVACRVLTSIQRRFVEQSSATLDPQADFSESDTQLLNLNASEGRNWHDWIFAVAPHTQRWMDARVGTSSGALDYSALSRVAGYLRAGASHETPSIREDIAGMRAELVKLRAEVSRLSDLLHQAIEAIPASLEVEVDEVGDDIARERILKLFKENKPGPLFYDEIADQASLPLRQVVEVCNDLESEGLIGEQASESHSRVNG